MPTLQLIRVSPDGACDKGTYDKAIRDENGVDGKAGFDYLNGNAKPSRRKRTKSILEELDFNGGDGIADDKALKGKENSLTSENAETATKFPKKRTICDFYSLSPKQDGRARRSSLAAEAATKRRKKRTTGKFVALNEDAGPIHVHVPFSGQEKRSLITIYAHCVESEYDVGDEPVVLINKYHRSLKVQAERFLGGFGRYIR